MTVAVFAAFLALEIGILATVAAGLAEFDASELYSSVLSLPLALFALLGLLRRRLWGWWCGVSYIALLILIVPVEIALDPEFVSDRDLLFGGLAAAGVWSMLCAGIVALLDSTAVRQSVTPAPPNSGYFRNLPSKAVFVVGSLLLLLALAMYRSSGWYALVVWLLLLGARYLWRSRVHAA